MTATARKEAPMNTLNASIEADLAAMKAAGTLKKFRHIAGPMDTEVDMTETGHALVLSSNNYLGLSNDQRVIEAGVAALKQYGAGTASVRFICGTFTVHEEIENAIAQMHGTEAALTYVSCWAANTGLMPTMRVARPSALAPTKSPAGVMLAAER